MQGHFISLTSFQHYDDSHNFSVSSDHSIFDKYKYGLAHALSAFRIYSTDVSSMGES